MVNMRALHFPGWLDALERDASLDASERKAYTITIRWYLSDCKRRSQAATVDSAKDFIADVSARKHPPKQALKQWKDAINWSRKGLRPTRLRSL